MAVQALNDAEITEALKALDSWERDGDALVKQFKFDSYLAGIAFASAVGVLSEARDHHPDLSIGWRKVTVRYSTHDAGNKISQKDVDTAQAVDGLGYPKAK
jgi:4a-hydroxytetrahydrobiopterin dehydratase